MIVVAAKKSRIAARAGRVPKQSLIRPLTVVDRLSTPTVTWRAMCNLMLQP
jgi:hypothetical protein